MSRVVDDDIVAGRDLGVGNEAEKGIDDVDTRGVYRIFKRQVLLGSEKELDTISGQAEVFSQVLLHQLYIWYTTTQRIGCILIDTNEYSPESRGVDVVRVLECD